MENKCRIGISNMHCTNCSGAVEKHFNKQDGIKVTVILANNEGIFTYDDTKWNLKKIESELKKIGYPMVKEKKDTKDLVKIIICVLLNIPLMVFMGITNKQGYIELLELIISFVVLLLLGLPFVKGAIRDIKNKRLGMDTLVAMGALVSYIYSFVVFVMAIDPTFAVMNHNPLYFDSCAMLLTVISIGKYIEKKAKAKTASSLKELMSLQEHDAKVLVDNKVQEKIIEDININDVIVVGVGEKIPLDGVVIDKVITVNESMISGESLPKTKNIGDNVYAGTIVVEGNTKIKVTNTHNNTYLSYLINKVEEIQANKPRLQKLADKVASIFVPIVLSLSLICFLVTIFVTNSLDEAIKRAVAVLVISCPCSLGLATPLSILIGSSRAIKLGIIYNNTEIFEKASKIDAIAFDKTGTLSYGEFEVVEANIPDKKYLDIIYSLEVISTHPLAKALVKYAKENNANLIELSNIKEVIGKGIESDDYFIYKDNNKVILTYKNKEVASLTLEDKINKDSKALINNLKEKNIDTYIFTGDSKEIAITVGNKLDVPINNIFYEIKPEDKLSLIEKLQENKFVCFVGDGINDALALNKANLSIAMGSGSDIAKSSADITLTNNNLNRLLDAINLSKRVYRNIIMNFIWAFSYNIVAIPLAFSGIINPMIASICMACSNILVVLNSLRLFINKENGKI